MAGLNPPTNEYARMFQDVQAAATANNMTVPEVWQLIGMVMEDDATYPPSFASESIRDGVKVTSMRQLVPPSLLAFLVRDLKKIPAGQAGCPANATPKQRLGYAAMMRRFEKLTGQVLNGQNFGQAARPMRTPDTKIILGGVSHPKSMSAASVKADMFELGYDVELFVEVGRQVVEVRAGRQVAVDLDNFESTLAREARIARENQAAVAAAAAAAAQAAAAAAEAAAQATQGVLKRTYTMMVSPFKRD